MFQTSANTRKCSHHSRSDGCCCTEYHQDKAGLAMSNGRFEEAEELLLESIREQPFEASLHSRLGLAYWRQGKTEDALNSLTRALELDQGNREAVVNCVEVFRAFGKEDDAQLVLSSYLQRNPEDEEVRRMMQPSQPAFATTQDCNHANFFTEQGEAQFAKGNLARARACFEMALENDPDHATALSNLAIVEWQDGNVEASLNLLYKALEANPEDPDILFNCVEILKSIGESESAAGLLQVYLRKGCGDQEAWRTYDSLLRGLGSRNWSPNGLSEKAASTYAAMGRELFLAGDRTGALGAFERASLIAPKDATVHHGIAQFLTEHDEIQESVTILETGLSHNPSHVGMISLLAGILANNGHQQDAIQFLEEAMDGHDDPALRTAWDELCRARG